LIGAYAAYELVRFAATPLLGGAADFTAAIGDRLGLLSVVWATIELVAACEVARFESRSPTANGLMPTLSQICRM